jgi:hypothetical protein
MNKYLELVEGSFNESHFNKQTSQYPYVAYSIKDDRVIYGIVPKEPKYLCLEPIDSNNQLALAKIGDYSNIQYSFDKSNWNDFTTDPTNPLNLTYISVDKPIYLKGNNPNGICNNPNGILTSGAGCKLISSGKYNVSGDVTTLLNENGDVKDLTPYGRGSFATLFGSIPSSLTGLPIDLPNVDIVDASKLILPATTLTENCYQSMFYGCTSLTTAPKLPATTLTENCYYRMFYGCTSLTIAPKLPATALDYSCYASMFYGCTSLTTAPELPATTLADFCYDNMFYNCTSLTAAPELPATELAEYCYQYMFRYCTSLTTAPELPAMTLAMSCYYSMFEGCTLLTTVPAILPATTLADYCYDSMFSNCASLTTAPELPATTLAEYCYSHMFSNCTSLNYIKCLATDISAKRCTIDWVNSVASTGTFVKHPDMNDWGRGISEIPYNWTVENAVL